MKDFLKRLSPEHISFICSECGITEEELSSMDASHLYNKVYRVLCEIAAEEEYFGGFGLYAGEGNERYEKASLLSCFIGTEIE